MYKNIRGKDTDVYTEDVGYFIEGKDKIAIHNSAQSVEQGKFVDSKMGIVKHSLYHSRCESVALCRECVVSMSGKWVRKRKW
jgi:hypothetical protein